MLSFDVDGPTLWVDDRATGRCDDARGFSIGAYGPWRGTPRLLDLLEDRALPATFFVPGEIVEQWPAVAKDIAASGHEIGHHGWMHETFYDHPSAAQRDIIARSQDLLERTTGRRAVGFRSPSGDIAADTPALLAELGFSYSSSMRGDDRPYRWEIDGRPTDLIEIPAHWELDDYQQFVYNESPPEPQGLDRIASTLATFDNWRREFDGYHRWGLCYVLMLHPQVIGKPQRVRALGRLLDHIGRQGDVWFATGAQIADWWRSRSVVPT
ncbi:polysaccharide deacetylase family protein [Streptomyces sp. RTd22]|uniref:polysaccharide deacetylase family protein n=1 Tax=Streptomyces sp. RTd22 TaxID=1841249 RepID=UPI001F32584D|nr:polysaccharide deacetylase [Streptomyces sp. RTd22]